MKILKGEEAKKVCDEILNGRTKEGKYLGPFAWGIFEEDEIWVAFDNSGGDMWMEEFYYANQAEEWLVEECEPKNDVVVDKEPQKKWKIVVEFNTIEGTTTAPDEETAIDNYFSGDFEAECETEQPYITVEEIK